MREKESDDRVFVNNTMWDVAHDISNMTNNPEKLKDKNECSKQ